VLGAVVDGDRRTVTFFVHEKRAKRIVADLEQNGRVALGFAQASHEAYQLRGKYISSRPSSEEDYAVQEAYKKIIRAGLMQFFPEELATPIAAVESDYRPSVAITFRVEEVFLQTPGPGAGTKMVVE